MSLSKVSLGEVVWKQFRYKWNSYTDAFKTLIIVQLIALFFSASGTGSSGGSAWTVSYNFRFYSIDIVWFFTMMWIFITAILLTSKSYRYEDFSFITNRLTSQLANYLFLIACVLIGTVTTLLASFPLHFIMLFINGGESFAPIPTLLPFEEFGLSFIGISFYLLLAGAAGYFLGALAQISKLFIIIIPAAFIFAPLFTMNYAAYEFFNDFYFQESSILLFILKIVGTSFALLLLSHIILNKKEVRI